MDIPRIPFKILAFAPFLGSDCPIWNQTPVKIDLFDPDLAMAELEPNCIISIPGSLYPGGSLEINFKKFKDFHPDTLIKSNPVLKNFLGSGTDTREASEKRYSAQEINNHPSQGINISPDQGRSDTNQTRATRSGSLDKIFDMVAMPDENHEITSGPQDIKSHVNTAIKEVLLNIFQDKEYRLIEKSWRGLHLLLRHVKAYENAVVEIVPVSMDSLADTLTTLTEELIEDLPSLIIFDLPIDDSPRSMQHLEIISRFSETLLIPAVTWISPKFFHIDHWKNIKKLSFLPHYLEEPSFAKWQTFRKTSSAKWMNITCNRIMERYPYGNDNQPRLVSFKESNPLWINPVWVIASLIGLSLVETGWPTQFTHWQEIRIQDLPLDTTDPAKPIPTEADFNRDRVDQFVRSGITPVIPMQGKDIVFIPDETTVGGSSLSYQLILSRITQLILWCKDHLEKGLQGEELENNLQKAFFLYWESTGHPRPDSLEIFVEPPNADSRIQVRIILEPSPSILRSRKKVEMQFYW